MKIQPSLVLAAAALLTLFPACSKAGRGQGAGTSGVSAGGESVIAVYGYDSEDKLVYYIVTDFDGNGTETSVSGTWNGWIKPENDPKATYQGRSDGITINGNDYLFRNGRVFLMSSASGTPTVTQMDIRVRQQGHELELERLEKHEDILAFVNPATRSPAEDSESPAPAEGGDE